MEKYIKAGKMWLCIAKVVVNFFQFITQHSASILHPTKIHENISQRFCRSCLRRKKYLQNTISMLPRYYAYILSSLSKRIADVFTRSCNDTFLLFDALTLLILPFGTHFYNKYIQLIHSDKEKPFFIDLN